MLKITNVAEKIEFNTSEIDRGTLQYLRQNLFGNSLIISDLRSENKGSRFESQSLSIWRGELYAVIIRANV